MPIDSKFPSNDIDLPTGARKAVNLFMGADLMAVFLPRTDSKTTVITFSSTNRGVQHTTPIISKFDKSFPANVVIITATKNHWYQTRELDSLAAILADVPQIAASRRIGYGSSMGSYGALLAARRFRLHEVVAVAARTVITGDHAPLHPDSAKWITETPIVDDDVPGSASHAERVRLIYDALLVSDRAHAAYLRARLPSVEELPLPFFGHPPYPPYQRAGIIRQTFTNIVLGKTEPSDFHRIRRELRNNSYIYWKNLAETARKRRHHDIVCQAVERALSLFSTEHSLLLDRWDLLEVKPPRHIERINLENQRAKLISWRDEAETALARSGRTTRDRADRHARGEHGGIAVRTTAFSERVHLDKDV